MVVRFYKRIVKSIDRASSLNCMLRPIKYQKFKKALVIFHWNCGAVKSVTGIFNQSSWEVYRRRKLFSDKPIVMH